MGISNLRPGKLPVVQDGGAITPGDDDEGNWIDEDNDLLLEEAQVSNHPMDSRAARHEHSRLMDWYYQERERQAVNRFQMAIDHDYYDNLQWAPEDAAEVRDRGQLPIVYNEVAPMCDWMIGTERRTRIDWKILPRTPDDVKGADTKTKIMKYLSDVNYAAFHRSRAFGDAVKAGVGWVEDGVRLDPSQELIFSRAEDWRNVLWDSSGYELDLSDARYLFRWRWVDLDIALAAFSDRAAMLKKAAISVAHFADEEDDIWYMNQLINDLESGGQSGFDRRTYTSDYSNANTRRARVKLIECQYRKPVMTPVIIGGAFNRVPFNEQDPSMVRAREAGEIEIEDHLMMRVHRAVMTDDGMIRWGVSPYRHNRFTLTPIWCYRRGRDRMPYGVVRRVRDIQDSLNKRMSKALWMVSSNQILTEAGATEDFDELAEEAARPDGVLVVKQGKRLELRSEADKVAATVDLAQNDAMKIQRSVGVADENLGRQTNAISGEAIKARQLQGSVVTTEPFDNLRMATQWQGEKRLSLAEQFISEPRVIRLTEGKGPLQWLKINQPVQQPDGSVVFEDDITATMADFVVSEQDFNGTLRQVMFTEMMALVAKAPDPVMQMRLLILAYDYSDMPNKDEIVAELRKLANVPDPNREPTPEEQQQLEQAKMRAEMLTRIQDETLLETLNEQRAKVQKLNAEAEEIRARALASGGDDAEIQAVLDESRRAQEQAAAEIESLSEKLQTALAEARDRSLEISTQADTAALVADIERDTAIRVAELEKESNGKLDAFQARMDQINEAVSQVIKAVGETKKEGDKQSGEVAAAVEELRNEIQEVAKGIGEQLKAEQTERAAERKEDKAESKAEPAATPVAAPSVQITLEAGAIQVDARKPDGPRTITVQAGNKTASATIKPTGGDDKGGKD